MKSVQDRRPSGRKPSQVTKPLPSDDKKRSTEDDYKVLLQCLPHANVWYREHLRRAFDHIFSEDHEPRVTFPARVREHGRSRFTTSKYRTGSSIVTRNKWMAHGLALMDGDPDIVALSPYPITIRYLGRNANNSVEWKDHIPDLAILRRNGAVGFMDFFHDIDTRRDDDRTNALQISLEEDCGATYEVMWATQILKQPRFFNRNLLHANRPRRGEVDLTIIERSILEQRLPMTIEELSNMLPLNVLVERWDDDARSSAEPVAGVHVVFSACLRLCYLGKVELDMSKPLSTSSIVSRRP
ncbi:hypothetical protein ACVMB2_007007 [Sinorhizobium meliloti]